MSGTRYVIVKDECSRYTWLYFLRHKSDDGSASGRFLTDVRADDVLSILEIVRSDNGGEMFGESFAMFVLNPFSSRSLP